MKNPDVTVVVALFVRVPIPGGVKTRLATELGNDEACCLYQAMVADILSNITSCGFPVYLFHDGNDVSELPEEWVKASSKVIAQTGDSIGEKMAAAFEYCFAHAIGQVILAGSDIPALDAQVVLSASTALESHDIAIAPAHDGGYCLIALKRKTYQPGVFTTIPWSTDQVLRTTLERCAACGLEAKLLGALQDIDTIEDIKAYCRNISDNAHATNLRLASSGYLTK
ncbi:MAG: TIGR04282 family arsenosugar biosynthesis glycosyltransferase [Desulfuromonadaceae bacterium]|nr:TIGR04282 family arsenosugar biosynthesis glycosyltransferase [Desulfuromonadaceae bacterium]